MVAYDEPALAIATCIVFSIGFLTGFWLAWRTMSQWRAIARYQKDALLKCIEEFARRRAPRRRVHYRRSPHA